MHVDASAKRKFKVLVVDDDPSGLMALSAALSVDFEVSSAPSPVGALEMLDRAPVDVICSDYQMEGMNGLRFLELATKRLPHVGCVLVTGSSAYLRSSRDEGLHYVLLKPYDPERLIGIVTQLALVTESKRSAGARDSQPPRARRLGGPPTGGRRAAGERAADARQASGRQTRGRRAGGRRAAGERAASPAEGASRRPPERAGAARAPAEKASP